MNLTDLNSMLQSLEALPQLDDCLWLNRPTYNRLREMLIIRNEFGPSVDLIGIKVYVDDQLADHVVESGTYVMEDGMVRRLVRHRYGI